MLANRHRQTAKCAYIFSRDCNGIRERLASEKVCSILVGVSGLHCCYHYATDVMATITTCGEDDGTL